MFIFSSRLSAGQVTDNEDDKTKIKVEDVSNGAEKSPNSQQQSPSHNQSLQQQSAQESLIATEIGAHAAASGPNETDVSASVALPTTVITTQRHRMITTTGQIR